jgi:GWxTD domain-containing protein
MKRLKTFHILAFATMVLWGCQSVQPIEEVSLQSKYYNWTNKNFHPKISVSERSDSSISYRIVIPYNDLQNSTGNQLEIKSTGQKVGGQVQYSQLFSIPNIQMENNTGYFSCIFKQPIDSGIVQLTFSIKESKSIREINLPIDYLPSQTGWVWKSEMGTGYCSSNQKLILPNCDKIQFQPRSEKLPSPPFSANAPFIPQEKSLIARQSDSTQLAPGAYQIFTGNSSQILQIIDEAKSPHFPEITRIEEMIGPIRYLCSKEEYERIQNSYEGPENAFDKFWIRSGGNKSKGKELIKVYYSRVQDANYHFTSYAEGWRTDRGMIYLVFGHPQAIITDDLQETWIYGNANDPQSLKFEFVKKKDPIWGIVYILQRSETYRTPWESQVTQWRQGRIYP